MKLVLNRTIVTGIATALTCLLSIALASGQAGPQATGQGGPGQKVIMAEDAFKDVQVLKGISVKEFMETMGFFAASLNANCTTCHGEDSGLGWNRYADETPEKTTARKMILMVNAMNQTYFGGARELTCYSCHRGAPQPKLTPNLAEQYGTPPPEDPDFISSQEPGAPAPTAVLDKYIKALGGAQKLATLTSFVAKGTYQGYADDTKYPVEIYGKAPGQAAQILHEDGGDSAWICDGRSAWVAQPQVETPVTVVALTAGDLDGARVEAELAFPGQVKQVLTKWRTGPPVELDGREVTVVEGTSAGGNGVKLYFEPKSGLLLRMVRYTNLPVGQIPTEIDYSDYRDVSGIKMPFHIVKTWVDGRAIIELSSIQPNVQIDAAKFTRPAPPVPPKATGH
jgi:photosynthetic reaction center cytochrome c subunit